jgi:hypothetical protein
VFETVVSLLACLFDAVWRRGDLAHFVLFVWAMGASGMLVMTVHDLLAAHRSLDAFVRKLTLIMTRRNDDS